MHCKQKRSAFPRNCQFSSAGQSLIQLFLEPFDHKTTPLKFKRLFQPKLGLISAIGAKSALGNLACSRLLDSGGRRERKRHAKSWRGGKKKKESSPSFLPFYFRVCAFLIQRTRLSWSLEQAISNWTVLALIKAAK